MKKALLIVGVMILAAVAFGLVSSAYAQAPTPADPGTPGGYYGQGGRGMRGQGMMAGGFYTAEGEYGPLHETIIAAMAEGLGIDAAELEARLENGESMYTIAASQGISLEDFQVLMLDARAAAFEQAVADGVITAEQAEWMQNRMQGAGGYGLGNCDGTGVPVGGGMGRQQGRGGMRGGR